MDSTEQKRNPAGADVASDIAAAIGLLPRLVRGRRIDAGLESIHVSVAEKEPGVMECKVQITGNDAASRDKIKEKFPASEGWTCVNGKGDKTATCTNP